MMRVLFPSLMLIVAAISCNSCDSESAGYDPDLRYPLRDDPLVLQTPPSHPTGPASPGELSQTIANLPDQGGVLAYPRTAQR